MSNADSFFGAMKGTVVTWLNSGLDNFIIAILLTKNAWWGFLVGASA